MNKKAKALLYNFIGFAILFILMHLLLEKFTNMTGYWIPFTSAVITSLLAPKFQAVNFQGEEKIFMRWLFIKGIKEIK